MFCLGENMTRKSVVNDSDKIGSKLRRIRLERHMTLAELARDLGISSGYLSSLETGREKPTRDLLEKYAEIFALSFDEIDFTQSFVEGEIRSFRRLQKLLSFLRNEHFEEGRLTEDQQHQLDALNENLSPSGLLFVWSKERDEYVLADWTSYRDFAEKQ